MKNWQEWKEEVVFHDGDRFFDRLCQAIDEARKSVDLETYLFDQDKLGRRVLNHLTEAARRGVKVRLLLDGFGCSQWSSTDASALIEAGVETRFFHPLPWQLPQGRWWRFRLSLGRLNRRNHRKTCVLDRSTAFLGGMNVSDRHSVRHTGSDAWRDTSVLVVGKNVRLLSHAFGLAWHQPQALRRRWRWKGNHLLPVRPGVIRLNVTRKQRRAEYADLLRRIVGAKRRVWIINPYFVPSFSLIRALRFAAWAGSDVRLIFPEKSDVWGMKWAVSSFYSVLLRMKVRIYEYVPSVLHAKIVLIDDWVKVGSSNLNSRSLLHDLEADVILSKPSSLESMERRFEVDFLQSKPIDRGSWRRRSWLTRGLEKFALLFKRWL